MITKTAQELADEVKRVAEDFAHAKRLNNEYDNESAVVRTRAALHVVIDALLSLAQASQARTDGEAVAWGMPDAAGNIVDTITEYDRRNDMTKWSAQYPIPLYITPPDSATQAAGAQWLPIETAPKDGTPLLVIDMTCLTPEADVAHWNNSWRACKAEDWDELNRGISGMEVYGIYASATHWMPLPASPAAELKKD